MTTRPVLARAPHDPDRAPPLPAFEVIPGTGEHPDLAHWRGNVGDPLALDVAPPAPEGVREVDVLSWNLAVGTARLEALLARLRDEDPGFGGRDPRRPLVVLAQEAYRADATVPERPATPHHGGWLVRAGQTNVADLAVSHGLSLRYAPSMRNGAERSDRGNAVLASVGIRAAHAFTLPYVKQRRVAVAADLEGVPGLTFVSAHLDTWGRPPGDRGPFWGFGTGRAAQAAELGRRIVRADGPGGVIVGADLNTPLGPRDPAVRALVGAGFTEARRVGRWGHTFHGPVRLHLDHVLFHDRERRIESVEVRRLDEHAGDRSARVFGSDHHPLLARVRLAAPEVS